MKRLPLSLLITLICSAAFAQQKLSFSVLEFEQDVFDTSAKSTEHGKKDGNGSWYAIIKVTSNNPDDDITACQFNFGNMSSKVEKHDEALWVYVQRNAKKVTISRPGYHTINQYDLQTTIEAGANYKMVLTSDRVLQQVVYDVKMQMVKFQTSPVVEGAMVTVTNESTGQKEPLGVTASNGAISKALKFGKYSYEVLTPDNLYYPSEGIVTLSSADDVFTENVVLRPHFADITLSVEKDADIYINNELKGKGRWVGKLSSGTYIVTCKNANHRDSQQKLNVVDGENQTITLTSPTPITGTLTINTTPTDASILVDGKDVGKSPKLIKDLIIGNHEVTFTLNGYKTETKHILVNEGKVVNLDVLLSAINKIQNTNAIGGAYSTLPLDESVRYGKLPNGLTYYVRHNETPKNKVNFYFAQKIGSIQEDDSQRGLTHFLEHLAVRSSASFPNDGIISACENMGVLFGVGLNAYTSTDESVYNIEDVSTSEQDNLEKCLKILHDWSCGLLLTTDDINRERENILSERKSFFSRILERQLPALYPGSKYGSRMPIGSMSVIENVGRAKLQEYYKQWFRPDLQGVIVVGDINVDEMEQKIKNILGSIPASRSSANYEPAPVPDNFEPIFVVDKDKDLDSGMIICYFKTEVSPIEMQGTIEEAMSNYINDIIASIINDRLYNKSQKEDCPFSQASIEFGQYLVSKTKDAMEVDIISKSGKDADAMRIVLQELSNAKKLGFSETEVKEASEKLLSRFERLYNNRDNTESRDLAQKFIRNFLDGDAAQSIEGQYEMMKTFTHQISRETINTVVQSMDLSGTNLVVLGMYPEKESIQSPSKDELKETFYTALSKSK